MKDKQTPKDVQIKDGFRMFNNPRRAGKVKPFEEPQTPKSKSSEEFPLMPKKLPFLTDDFDEDRVKANLIQLADKEGTLEREETDEEIRFKGSFTLKHDA